MSKQDKYRFNLRFDETDEEHRRVCEFLNSCGRKKARYVVKAFRAYWASLDTDMSEQIVNVKEQPEETLNEENGFVNLDDTYNIDQAEIELMKKNYAVLKDLE